MNDEIRLWRELEQSLSDMCDASAACRFIPLLEADIAGFLYHSRMVHTGGDASRLHLDTRLFGASDNDKFDLVIGAVVTSTEQQLALLEVLAKSGSEDQRKIAASKSFAAQLRPQVSADIVLEFKLFAPGFSPQQNREHLRQVHEDISRLRTLVKRYPKGRGILLVDTQKYVNKSRQEELVRTRGEDRDIRLYLCQLDEASSEWHRVPHGEA